MSPAGEPHGAVLSESLRRLQLQAASMDNDTSHAMIDEHRDAHEHDSRDTGSPKDPQILSSRASIHPSNVREGYGFRPVSGASTPVTAVTQIAEQGSPLPDPNGLGWPGEQFYPP